MEWSKYGQWRHPKEWWELKLIEWMRIKHPDTLKYNPKIDSITDTHIKFGMKKHYGVLRIDKETILKDLENENVKTETENNNPKSRSNK